MLRLVSIDSNSNSHLLAEPGGQKGISERTAHQTIEDGVAILAEHSVGFPETGTLKMLHAMQETDAR